MKSMEKQWILYILECRDGTLYTGITDDLNRRLKAHNDGKGAKYTRGRGPVRLLYREECADHGAALSRELAVKRMSREKKRELIRHGAEADSKETEMSDGGRMMKKERTLVVLAAGIGSRFSGGIKQLQPVGPSGEVIMDYAIHDAIEAGFNRVLFIIRHDIEELFEQIIGSRVRPVCEKMGIEVLLAYQEKTDLPGGYICPADRVKPWGTGQALLACKGMLHGGFAVINADDYYGKDAYRKAFSYLDTLEEGSQGKYGLIGFSLGNTLSDNGGVTRGLCEMDENGLLTSIIETKKIVKIPDGAGVERDGVMCPLDGAIPVSMNMWAFTPDVLDRMEARFTEFLSRELENPKSEFLIPTEIGGMLAQGVEVQVLPTDSRWFGMTFAEDMPGVREAFREMTEKGIYPSPLH